MEERQIDKQIINHHHHHHHYDNLTSSSACFALMSLSAKRRAQCRHSPSRPTEHQFTSETVEEESELMLLPTEDLELITSVEPTTLEEKKKEYTSDIVNGNKPFNRSNMCINTNKKHNNCIVLRKAQAAFEAKQENSNNSNKNKVINRREETPSSRYYHDNSKYTTINNNNYHDRNKYSLSCSRSRESPSSSNTLSSSSSSLLLLSNKLEWYRSSQSDPQSQLHHTYNSNTIINNEKRENDSVHLNFARLFSSRQRLISTTVTEKTKSSKRARKDACDKESTPINCFLNNISNNNINSSRRMSRRSNSRKSNLREQINNKNNSNVNKIKEHCRKNVVKMPSHQQMMQEEIRKESENRENSTSDHHECTSSAQLQTSSLSSPTPLVETEKLPEMLLHILHEHSKQRESKATAATERHLCNNTDRCHTNKETHQKRNHTVNSEKNKPSQIQLNRSISKKRQSSKSVEKRVDTNKSATTTSSTTMITNMKDSQIKTTIKNLVKPAALSVSKEQRRRELYAWNKMLRAAEESGVVTQDAV